MHVEREAGHIEEVENRFYTGNRVFDEIVGLSYGMAVLVLDETMHEGRLFLLSLLKDHPVAEVVSTRQSPGDPRKLYIELDNPQDVSIQLSRLRKNLNKRVLIHTYLQELVVRHGEEIVLKLVDNIISDIKRTGSIEFFLLPKGTFASFERKLMAVVDGALEIEVQRLQSGVEYAFTPIRISSPEYHLKPISYAYEQGELKIFPSKTLSPAAVEDLALKLAVDREGVLAWGVTFAKNIPVSEYFFVRELVGLRLAWIGEIFQDMPENFYRKVAEYVYNGYLAVEKKAPTVLRDRLKNYVSMLRMLTHPESVAFLGELCSYLGVDLPKEEVGRRIRGMREFFARMYVYAMQYTGEDYSTAVENILETVVGKDIKFSRKAENTYLLEVRDCRLCKEPTLLSPICGEAITDLVRGVTGCVLGAGAELSETECISKGGRRCVFQCHIVKQP
jgi:predicted hydrocarbon binding protein